MKKIIFDFLAALVQIGSFAGPSLAFTIIKKR